MPGTISADFAFVPKVWQDHIMAYFDRKLVYGAFALRDDSLTASPGLTQNFPYFKKIGAVQKPTEDEGLLVDNLTDDSFNVTVYEVSKAVGASKKSFKTSAARTERIINEIQEQIGRVFAEQIDADLYTEFSAHYTSGFLATAAGDTMHIRNLNKGKIVAFGDKHKDAQVCFMHSFQYLDLMTDTTAGFLVANALDPMFMVEGFEGRLAGLALVTVDTVTKNAGTGTQIGGKDSYDAWIHKANAYGFMVKQDMELESDYDILHRQWVFAGDQWYGVKSFDQTISSDFKKTARLRTTSVN
jgi:hypothetical protein